MIVACVRAALCAAAVSALVLAGCSAATSDQPHVVVTTNILGDVVENIAGDEVAITTLMKPNADPHSFEISAQQAHELSQADLLVSSGLNLEEGLGQHVETAQQAGVPSVVAGEHIEVLTYSSDDNRGEPDPHFWTDPARMIDVVDAVEEALVDVPGVNKDTVRTNADSYRAELKQLDEEMTAAFESIPRDKRALVTNHHVFGYLAERFGFDIIGAVIPGGTTLAAPSAADLRELTEAIEQSGVKTIFAESSQPDRLVSVLASEANVEVSVVELFTESLTASDGEAPTYLTMMRANTERITDGLTR